MFWLARTQGTALVYPQAQLSTPNPPIRGPAPGMSGQLGSSHSKRLPQRLISHVQEDAAAIRKFSLQSDLNPSSEEAHQLSFPVPPASPEGSGLAPQHPSPHQDLPIPPLLPRVACPNMTVTLPTTPIFQCHSGLPATMVPFAGLLSHVLAPCSQVHSHNITRVKSSNFSVSLSPLPSGLCGPRARALPPAHSL